MITSERDEQQTLVIRDKPLAIIKADLIHAFLSINDLSHSVLSPTSFRVEYKRGVNTVFQRNVRFHVDINLATPGAICNQENIRLADGSMETDRSTTNPMTGQQQAPGSVMKAVNAINATMNEAENNTRNVMINKNTLSVNSPEQSANQCSSSSSSETETNLLNNFNNAVNSGSNNKTANAVTAKKPLLYVLTFTLIAGPVRRFKRICDHLQVQISGRTRPTAAVHTKANSTSNSTQSSDSNLSTTSKSGESNLSLLNNQNQSINHSNLNNRERELKEKELMKAGGSPVGQPVGNQQQIHLNNNPTNLNAINSFAANAPNNTTTPTAGNNNNPNNLTAKSPKQMHSKNRDLSDSSCGSCLSDTNHSSLNNNQSSDENMTVNLVANSIRTTTNSSATTSNLISSNKLSGKSGGLALARCKSENPQQALLFSSNVSPFEKDASNPSNSSGISSVGQQTASALNGNKPAGLRFPNRKLSLDQKLTTD